MLFQKRVSASPTSWYPCGSIAIEHGPNMMGTAWCDFDLFEVIDSIKKYFEYDMKIEMSCMKKTHSIWLILCKVFGELWEFFPKKRLQLTIRYLLLLIFFQKNFRTNLHEVHIIGYIFIADCKKKQQKKTNMDIWSEFNRNVLQKVVLKLSNTRQWLWFWAPVIQSNKEKVKGRSTVWFFLDICLKYSFPLIIIKVLTLKVKII